MGKAAEGPNADERLDGVDEAIREAIASLNHLHAGKLRIIFLSGAEEEELRASLGGGVKQEQFAADLDRLDSALRSWKSTATHSKEDALVRN